MSLEAILVAPHPRTDTVRWLPACAGFFFVFRAAITFLFFQSDPATATALGVAADLGLLLCSCFCLSGTDSHHHTAEAATSPNALRWILAFLLFALLSLAWTGASSRGVAFAYWTGMAADAALGYLLILQHSQCMTDSIAAGAVWGGAALAIIGWCAPRTEDLRLGNDEFLHPNTLGLEIGLAALLAQYLSRRGPMWRWLAIGLAITLLRTLSKTAIIAFLVAEAWYLLQSRQWTRATRVRIAAASAVVVACFWGVLSAYADIYASTGRGDQLETLTGRTVLWAETFAIGVERPWLGHGVYSFKSLIPALGTFAPVHAHNELLQQFFEYGLIGVVLVAAIYLSFLRLAWKSPKSELRSLAIALWIFAVVRGLTDAVVAELSFPLWLMLPLAVCLAQSRVAPEVAQ